MQRRVFSLFWRGAMHYPFRTTMALLGSAAAAAVGGYAGPFIVAQLLEKLQSGTVTVDSSAPLIMLYILTQIYGQIISWRLNLFFTWTMQTAAQRDLYRQIFSRLTEQSLGFHADRFGGALVSQTTKLIGAFERFWDTMIFQLVPTLASVVAAVVILGLIFWQYAVVLLALSLIFVVAVLLGARLLAIRNREEAQASTATNAYVADAVTNIMTIKAHGREAEELATLTGRANAWRQKSLSSMRGFLALSTGYSTLNAMTNVAALIAAIWASEHHLISIGTVYLSITYTLIVARQLWEMNSIMRNYNRIMGDAHDMTEILNLEPAVIDKSTTPLQVAKGAISFNAVTFTHAGDSEPLFDKFSLAVKAGERIGLVGRSGSGKTTLTRLLLRFSDIDQGEITIDGQDITRVTQKSLRQSIAYVPQEPLLFHRTLRENIGYGKSGATNEQIIKAAKQANALEFIEKLPQQFDTMVGERGVKLSGGQRQRIAIARAILMDAPILVLDEATSALDSDSERLIQQALQTLMKGRTVIVIAHRLSTVQKMDRIVVLENGLINEQGSHQELLAKKGTYADLWHHQSGGFIEE